MKKFTLLSFALGLFLSSAPTCTGQLPDNTDEYDVYIVDFFDGQEAAGTAYLKELEAENEIILETVLTSLGDAIIKAPESVVTEIRAQTMVKVAEKDTPMEVLNIEDNGGERRRLRRRDRNLSVTTTNNAIGSTNAQLIPNIDTAPGNKSWKKICLVDSGYDITNTHLPTLVDDDNDTNGYSPHGWDEKWSNDPIGHGTRMASLLAGKGDNDSIKGIMNVGRAVDFDNFFIAKALKEDGTTTTAQVIDAMNKCEENEAKVIILSVTTTTFSQAFKDAVQTLFVEKDCLLFAPTGDQGNSDYLYPAAYEHVISVGAVDDDKAAADFSQHNDQNEIMAPGVKLDTMLTFGSEEYLTGTSVAVPFVAGSAALIWSFFDLCKPMQIRYALANTANREVFEDDYGDCGTHMGHGIVDAKAAYDYLNTHPCTGDDSLTKWNAEYRANTIVESGNCFGTVVQPSTTSPGLSSSSFTSSSSTSSQQSSTSTEGCESWCSIATVPWKPASAGALAKCDWTGYCDKCSECTCKSWCSAIPETDIPWNATSTGGLSKCGTFESFCGGCEEC